MVLFGLSLPLLIAGSALGVELANNLALTTRNQAVADMAALAAASVYGANGQTSSALAAARNVIGASGLSGDLAQVAIVTSPADASRQAVRLYFATQERYYLSRIFHTGGVMQVGVVAMAQLGLDVSPCLLALEAGSGQGVLVSGGSSLVGSGCDLATNSAVYAQGGSTINAKKISAGSTIGTPLNDSSISTSPSANQIFANQPALADPLASSTSVATATALLGQYTAVTAPSLSLTGTTSYTPGWFPTLYLINGNLAIFNGFNWTFPPGTYNIDNLNLTNWIPVIFQGPVTLNIRGNLVSNGPSVQIGVGASGNVVNIGGNLSVGGGGNFAIGNGTVNVLGTTTTASPVTIGIGQHYFGRITTGAAFNVGVGGTAANNSTTINGTLSIGGGFAANFGGGPFAISKSAGQTDAVNVGGGSTFTVGDGTFSVNGNFTGQGSSTVSFGATPVHYFNGDLTLAGNSTFGAGTYAIAGNFSNGTTGAMTGTDVSFVLGGNWTMGGSAAINIRAPVSTSSTGIPGFLLISRTSADSSFYAGSNSVFSGIVYLPNSALNVSSGGALSAGSASGACWSMVVRKISITNGARLTATQCPMPPSTGSTLPKLVR